MRFHVKTIVVSVTGLGWLAGAPLSASGGLGFDLATKLQASLARAEALSSGADEGISGSPAGPSEAGAAAEEEAQAPSPPPQAEARPRYQELFDKLQIHGFLTQAYAEASFGEGGFQSPVPDEIILGIPEEGTTDYRNLAIQFRYEITPKDIAVLQLSHRRLGNSPLTEVESDVELDWAFYERRLADHTYLKFGRIQIPLGIFNEIRDVGTLLPFFRPTFTFYREGSFSSETVDGIMFGHGFWKDKNWNFDFDVYYGGWDLIEVDQSTGRSDIARAEDAVGLHFWVYTPHPGIRIGGGGQTYNVSGGFLRRPGTQTTWYDYHLSFDGVFSRFVFRTEVRRNRFLATFPNLREVKVPLDAYYAQFGYFITPKWRVWAQFEKAEAERSSRSFANTIKLNFRRDYAVALNYLLRPNVVFKAEHHLVDIDTFTVVQVVPTPEGPKLRWATRPSEDGRQTIVSVSVSF